MANYEAWNSAIANYFTAGASHGSPIFLSLDDEAIKKIAYNFLDEQIDDPMDDYITAVKSYCMQHSDSKIDLDVFRNIIAGVPAGTGFLGLMVLAAYHMKDDDDFGDLNYFLRLREVLSLPSIQERPNGMPTGSEEFLWTQWNMYLKRSGFEPTATEGSGPQKYLRYPLSQAILRESDKQFLGQRFRESKIDLQKDTSQLGFWLSRQQINRIHLKEGLHHTDPARVWAFYQEAFSFYNEKSWTNSNLQQKQSLSQKTHAIECGIYRVETLFGSVNYRIFPKQPARSRLTQLYTFRKDTNTTELLKPLKEGYFRPLWSQIPFVDAPMQFAVSGDPNIQYLSFPKRDFWILSSELDNPQSALATWKPYHLLGDKLLVLCKNGPFTEEMSHLKRDKLVDWTHQLQREGWVEYYNCMGLSYNFGGFMGASECRALVNSLAPTSLAGVSLSGGLRDNTQNAWLEGFPPSLNIYGFEAQFEVIVKAGKGNEIFRDEVSQQQKIPLPKNIEPDIYEIEISWNNEIVARRTFRLISWDDIQENRDLEEIINSNILSTGGISLTGPFIV